MLNYPYLSKKRLRNYLKKIFSKVIVTDKFTKVFNSYFVNDIKDPYIDKVNKKIYSVMHFNNDEKKYLLLIN